MKKVYVLGDSISIHYGPYFKQFTQGVFAYDRKRGDEALEDLDQPVGANGGDSRRILSYLSSSGEWKDADILLVNCGLHDLKKDRETKIYQVDLAEYADNLKKAVDVIKQTDITPVWVNTTPVDGQMHAERKPFDRFNEDVLQYNSVAEKIMQDQQIDILDLYTFTANIRLDEPLQRDGVHFIEPVRARQAAFIAGWLSAFTKERLGGA